jgi:hypothetical protein
MHSVITYSSVMIYSLLGCRVWLSLFSVPVGVCSCVAFAASAVFCVGLRCWVGLFPACASRFPASFPPPSFVSPLRLFVTLTAWVSSCAHLELPALPLGRTTLEVRIISQFGCYIQHQLFL